MSKPCIIFVSPGPTFRPHSEMYQSSYKELSNHFRGYIFTTSGAAEQMNIGDFVYESTKFRQGTYSLIRFFAFCVARGLNAVRKGGKVDMIVTYDPLKTGLIGLALSRILGAKFAPEVNGVYTSPAEWLDVPDSAMKSIKQFIYPHIMRLVLKGADGARLLFKSQIDQFSDVMAGKIVRDFHCFVPVDNFKKIKENREVLFVGFPFKRKGVDILIKAFKKIAGKYPDWKLKILGWYPNARELNDEIDNHPQIYHHPPVHYQEMPEHIGSCALLVLPSRSEAMGRVLVEAMAAGKPVIGSNVDGIPTVIEDGVNGFLVKPEDVDDLAEKLDTLVASPDLRHRLGSAGRDRALKEFTAEMYTENLTRFYREVIERG